MAKLVRLPTRNLTTLSTASDGCYIATATPLHKCAATAALADADYEVDEPSPPLARIHLRLEAAPKELRPLAGPRRRRLLP